MEGFNAVTSVLSSIVQKIDKEKDSARLLKHIIRCYYRLTDNPGAKDLLKTSIPLQLKELSNILDNSTKKILGQLFSSLGL
jgi:CCR4-NOT transcription complex subunit 9